MKRLPQWPEALAAIEAELQAEAWAWGVHDCAATTVRVVEALTGEALAMEPLTVAERMSTTEPDLIEAAEQLARKLDLSGCVPELLQRGDPCLVRHVTAEGEGVTVLGFISTRGFPTIASQRGLTELTHGHVLRGWSIPS